MAKKSWIYGKNVLITGVSSGIGFYLSKFLCLEHGCNVVGISRNEERLKKAKEDIDLDIEKIKKDGKNSPGTFDYLVNDVSSISAWQNIKTALDGKGFKVDVLINNAGIFLPFEKFENQSLEMAKRVMETNFFAHLYSYKTFIQDIEERNGAIINIASSSALCPVVGTAVYSASKAACKNFTESLIAEHRGQLYIAYVCPGYTLTNLFREEKEMSKLVQRFSMQASKMAKKIIKRLVKKRKRIVIGLDAHLMSGLYRISPKFASWTVSAVLKGSHDAMFSKVFIENTKKREDKK